MKASLRRGSHDGEIREVPPYAKIVYSIFALRCGLARCTGNVVGSCERPSHFH